MASLLLRVVLAGLVLTALVAPRAVASERVEPGEHAVAAAPGAELPETTRASDAQSLAQAHVAHAPRPVLSRPAAVVHCEVVPELAPAEGYRPMPRDYLPRRRVSGLGDDGDDH